MNTYINISKNNHTTVMSTIFHLCFTYLFCISKSRRRPCCSASTVHSHDVQISEHTSNDPSERSPVYSLHPPPPFLGSASAEALVFENGGHISKQLSSSRQNRAAPTPTTPTFANKNTLFPHRSRRGAEFSDFMLKTDFPNAGAFWQLRV